MSKKLIGFVAAIVVAITLGIAGNASALGSVTDYNCKTFVGSTSSYTISSQYGNTLHNSDGSAGPNASIASSYITGGVHHGFWGTSLPSSHTIFHATSGAVYQSVFSVTIQGVTRNYNVSSMANC